MTKELDEFGKEQDRLVNEIRVFSLSEHNAFMEKLTLIKSLQILRGKIFDLSYQPVHENALSLEKGLCDDIGRKWDKNDNFCILTKEDMID